MAIDPLAGRCLQNLRLEVVKDGDDDDDNDNYRGLPCWLEAALKTTIDDDSRRRPFNLQQFENFNGDE